MRWWWWWWSSHRIYIWDFLLLFIYSKRVVQIIFIALNGIVRNCLSDQIQMIFKMRAPQSMMTKKKHIKSQIATAKLNQKKNICLAPIKHKIKILRSERHRRITDRGFLYPFSFFCLIFHSVCYVVIKNHNLMFGPQQYTMDASLNDRIFLWCRFSVGLFECICALPSDEMNQSIGKQGFNLQWKIIGCSKCFVKLRNCIELMYMPACLCTVYFICGYVLYFGHAHVM